MKTSFFILFIFLCTHCWSQSTTSYEKGNIAFDDGNFAEAVKWYSEYIQSLPPAQGGWSAKPLVPVYLYRGMAYHQLQNLELAMKDYNMAIDLRPQEHKAFALRGDLKSSLGDHTGGIKDIDQAINIHPEGEYFNQRGIIKGRLEQYDYAILDFNEAIERDQKNASAYRNRGYAKILKNKKEEGCKDLSKAGELGDFGAYNLIKEYCNS